MLVFICWKKQNVFPVMVFLGLISFAFEFGYTSCRVFCYLFDGDMMNAYFVVPDLFPDFCPYVLFQRRVSSKKPAVYTRFSRWGSNCLRFCRVSFSNFTGVIS
jgi:hypothetical protein